MGKTTWDFFLYFYCDSTTHYMEHLNNLFSKLKTKKIGNMLKDIFSG